MSSNGAKEPLEQKFNNQIPKTKSAQNNRENAGIGYKIQNRACGPNMSSNGAQELLEKKFNNQMPKTKSAQNKLKMLELAIKSKIVHLVQI